MSLSPSIFKGYLLVFRGEQAFFDIAKGSRVCEFFSVDDEREDTKIV